MVKFKQTITLPYLDRYSIKKIEVEGNIVTLKRADGVDFNFIAKGTDGTKGVTGDKGKTGARGESAYDIAVRLGKTDKDINGWLADLKGDKGPVGTAGKNGYNGTTNVDGDLPSVILTPIVWLPAGQEPYVNVATEGLVCTMTLGIPVGPTGDQGDSNHEKYVSTGTYTTSEPGTNANVTIVDGKLNVTIPAGTKGKDGVSTVGLAGNAPYIDLFVEYIDSGQQPVVTYEGNQTVQGRPWTRSFTVKIPKGITGDKGLRGPQGLDRGVNKPAIMKILTSEVDVQEPGHGMCVISMDDFMGYAGKAYGWCWRSSDVTLQLVHFVQESNGDQTGWWYRTGPATGLVAETISSGWKRSVLSP